MAKAQITDMCFLTLLFFLAFPIAKAIPKSEVVNLCRETTDPAFCTTQIESDPRVAAARDLNGVLTIVVSLTKIQVDNANTHLNSVRSKFNGPNGKRRINVCKKNYETASARFQSAWSMGLNKNYPEANRLLNEGTQAVTACENGWSTGGPKQKSPLTQYNTNISKLSGISQLIIRKLSGPK